MRVVVEDPLVRFVLRHTRIVRDAGLDMICCRVEIVGEPIAEEFIRLSTAHAGAINPLDGQGHDFAEVATWIGEQAMALRYMALGSLLGVLNLSRPRMIFGQLTDLFPLRIASYLTIQVARDDPPDLGTMFAGDP